MRSISTLMFFASILTLGISAQTICIDPGHGIDEDGVNRDGRTWEEISTNVAVGLYLRDSLEKRGYNVIMTRESSDSGSWMSLTQRAELADSYESDRLLSIHCNAGGGDGTETFWSKRNTQNYHVDRIFSDLIQKHMVTVGEWNSRRSMEDEIYFGYKLGVLKGFTPGCLNEIGFVDTPSNLEKLLNEDWRQKFAQAYAFAIDESFTVNFPSGVKEKEKFEISVYPNPFRNEIKILSSINAEIKIIITNSEGVILLDMEDYVSSNELILHNVERFLPGMYFLSVQTNNTSKTFKLLKF